MMIILLRKLNLLLKKLMYITKYQIKLNNQIIIKIMTILVWKVKKYTKIKNTIIVRQKKVKMIILMISMMTYSKHLNNNTTIIIMTTTTQNHSKRA